MGEVARAFSLLNSLQNLRVVVRLPTGALADVPVVITEGGAVIDLTGLSPVAPACAPRVTPPTVTNAKDAAKNPKTGVDRFS